MPNNSQFLGGKTLPSRQSSPCPPWCRLLHNSQDATYDQFHIGSIHYLGLTELLTPPDEPYVVKGIEASYLTLSLSQAASTRHPRLWLGAEEGPQGFNLSIPETQHLAGLLTRLAENASI